MRTIYQQMLIALLAMIPVGAWAQTTFTQGDFTYTVTDEDAKTVSIAKAEAATLTGALVIPSNVTYETVTYAVTSVGDGGFYGPEITSVTIPASVMTIGNEAFQNCNSLASITIEDSETPLTMSGAWYERPLWSPASTIYIGRDLTLTGGENNPLTYDATTVEFGPKVTTINPALFYSNSHLASITIGSGVTTIGESAFYSCGQDEGVTETVVSMGSNVTSIGANAFRDCTKLKSVTLPSTLTTIDNLAFNGCSALTSITIPASVMTIGNEAFQNCNSMTSIRIEDSETPLTMPGTFYERPFWNDATTIYIGRNLTLTGGENNPLLYGATSVEFGPKVTTINPALFYSNANLASITIGSGVTTIGDGAFQSSGTYWDEENNQGVEELVVTMGDNVTSIGVNAFRDCTKLKSIPLSSKLASIGDYAFFKCSALTSVTIPASVQTIGDQVFYYVDEMKNFTIEDGNTSLTIGDLGWGISGENFYLGRDVTYNSTLSGQLVFSNAQHVTIGPNVKTLNNNMFYERNRIKSVDLTQATSLTTIGDYVFYHCDSLENITIPATVTTIGKEAFLFTDRLNNVIFVDGDATLTMDSSIGSGLCGQSMYLGRNISGPTTRFVWTDCKTLTVGPKVTTLYANMFKESALETIDLTNATSLTTLGADVFGSCTKLEEVKVGWLTPLDINDNAFNGSITHEDETYATLNVPAGTKTAYAAADGWKNFEHVAHWSTLVTLTASNHGSIVTEEATASNGTEQYRQPKNDDIVYTLTADEGYELTALTDNDAAVSPLPTLGEEQTRANTEGEEFVTLNATFSAISYTLNYELAGGSVASANPTTYTIESAAITLNNPTREGYNFTGWKLNGEGEAMTEVIIAKGSTGDKSYTATWTPIIYNIALTLDGGTAENPTTYTIESEAITLTNPTKTGYTFKGWKLNGEGKAMMEVIIAKGSTGDKAYTATWQINQYTITIDKNDGTDVTVITQEYATVVEAPATPTRTGYTFAGWTPEVPATIPAENITCIAQWTVNQYTITFNTAGGSVVDPITQDYATAVVAPANPTREGYTFAGWDNEIPTSIPAENVTINATWTPVSYTISYDLAGGAFAVQDDVVLNINATTGAWTATNANGTWASKWESTSDNPHVKFIASGNNMSFYDGTNIQCYNTYGGTTTNTNYLIQAPEGWYITRVNFDFVANSANGVAVTLNGNQSAQSLSTTDTKHLEATNICKNEVIMNVAMVNANSVFAQLTNFVVELTAHPTAYTIESGAFTIENPTSTGFDFAGWTGTGLEAATKDVTIATGSTGDRSYTATWTAAVYAVSITGGGVSADNMNPEYGESVTITIAEDEDRELNTLTVNGVDVTTSVKDGKYTIENVTGNVVVVATFNSTKEFITLPASSDYATFSCSQDLDFSEVSGLKAYIASGFDKTTGTVLLTRVESVPAGTGLLLRGTAGETYKVPYAESASYYVNMLKPVPTATTIAQTEGDYTNYFLGKQGDPEVIGFYKGKAEGTAVSAQKAYLQLPTSAVAGTKSIGIYFDDTTGVGEVKASTMAPEGVYDIHGRKIPAGQKLTRGIYIINGKKVSIK